jgi:hypothetical protein
MDGSAIVITASAAAAVGLGAGAGFKLIPALFEARRDLANAHQGYNDQPPIPAHQFFPSSKLRETSIVGLYRDSLRHADGSFTRAYHAQLEPSVFCDDLTLENRCNALARLLAARKPVGRSSNSAFLLISIRGSHWRNTRRCAITAKFINLPRSFTMKA